ncbi:MAG TPA: histidine kinase [Gemmatimonadales bacterium]|jgi:signal transduction histidine kinase
MPPSRSSRRLWLFGLLIWTILGLMSAAQAATWRIYGGRYVDWGALVPTALADWLTCGMFTPAFYWMVRRFPIRGERWGSSLPIHLGASLVFVVLKVTAFAPLFRLLNPGEGRTWSMVLFGGFYADMLAYWASVGVIHAIEYYRESRERQLEATRLALENLRAQLQPHFLFNTLQSISTLIYRDPRAADRMLTDLSELLRLSLRTTGAQEVPLAEELGFLGRYLEIMRVRFGDRLVIAVDTSPDLTDALVPSLILQPIVENAIEHGMADRPDIGHVTVRATHDGTALHLEVSDDGPGLPPMPSNEGRGIGLANTRERLARLYGATGRIDTSSPNGGGVTVRLTIPLRLKAAG